MTTIYRTMKTTMVVLAMATVAVSASAKDKNPEDKVPVFVRSAGNAGGFTDVSKDRVDSVKDLTNGVQHSDTLRVAIDEDRAAVVLEVEARETRREVNGWSMISGAAQNKSYVTVKVIAGEYTTEFSGESGSKGMMSGYKDAANRIIKQVEKWVETNHDRLVDLKTAKPTQVQ